MLKGRTNFIIKPPDTTRRSFSILIQTTPPNGGKPTYKVLKDARLDNINKEWKASNQTPPEQEKLLRLVEEIRKELNDVTRKREGRDRLIKNSDNEKILEDFFDDRLRERRDITSGDVQMLDFSRAVRLIGNISLKTAKKADIVSAIGKIKDNNLHRRVCSRINSLLNFIGRPERIKGAKPIYKAFYLKEHEFLKLYSYYEAPVTHPNHTRNIQNLFITLYYTGLRMGEAFCLQNSKEQYRDLQRTLNYISGNKVYVNSQMLIDGTFFDTKTRKKRTSYIYPNDLMKRIQEWVDLDLELKKEIRAVNYTHVLQRALKNAFGNKYSDYKEMKPHDHRHAFANLLLQEGGLNISQIAKVLGNGVTVCEKYYLEDSASDESLDLMDSIVKRNRKPKLKVV